MRHRQSATISHPLLDRCANRKCLEGVALDSTAHGQEWSAEGAAERAGCFGLIGDELVKRLEPFASGGRRLQRVLVPGSGLGRLPYDISRLGYHCQGNEFSYFMLLGSNFILNRCAPEPLTLQPWAHHLSNSHSLADQLRVLSVPDVAPADAPPPGYFSHGRNCQYVATPSTLVGVPMGQMRGRQQIDSTAPLLGDFSMCAGDFVEVYSAQPGEWDSIVTCFFIDTAPNVFDYIRTIHTALRPGGVWINFGPLLYHFEEMYAEMSVELPLDELMAVIASFGFEIVQRQENLPCCYTSNCRSHAPRIQLEHLCTGRATPAANVQCAP